MPANDKLTQLKQKRQLDLFFNIKPMLEKFIAGDFIAITSEMCQFPASNENTDLYDTYVEPESITCVIVT